MGKDKIRKCIEFDGMPHTYDAQNRVSRGSWRGSVFHNDHPLVLELACGKGEYTCGLSGLYPDKNFIGVDIKGARMWRGAKFTFEHRRRNAAFLRQQIELIDQYFGEGEVNEIWIIFPDPQPQDSRIKKRLTSPRFLELYRRICTKDCVVHLKTDSELLYQYTLEVIKAERLTVVQQVPDIDVLSVMPPELAIRTHYENIWRKEGKAIRYLSFYVFSTSIPYP